MFEVQANGNNATLFLNLDGTVSGDAKGIAVHPLTGNIWIAADDADSIFEFDRSSPVPNLISSISTIGLLPSFLEPEGLAFLGLDLIVSDDGDSTETLYLVSTSGQLLQTIVDTDAEGLGDPEGVANISDTRICAAGDLDNAILCFEITGCGPHDVGDWNVSFDCTMAQNATAPANVVLLENSSLTIASGVALDIDFSAHHLRVKDGAKVVIKPGGVIH